MNYAILTIDDIASKNTPAIVDYLNEKGIKAVFFATGKNVQRYYAEAMYAVKNGMIVGNHSYSHPQFSKLSVPKCLEEIVECEHILDKLYKDCGVERTVRPFRFPYGDKGGANRAILQQYLSENHFHKLDDSKLTYPWWKANNLHVDIDTLWTFDFAEYGIRPNSRFTKENVMARIHDLNPGYGAALLGEGNAHIVLMHAHDETEEMLPGYYKLFLDYVIEKGVVFEEPRFI